VEHAESQSRAQLFVRSQASAFNRTAVYAPKYRQAAFGAFLDTGKDATAALDLAYGDIARAFDRFLAQVPDGPIVLAGHSQGALHLTRLLRDRVAKDPALARRVVAAYVVGWPVSSAADIPAMGLAACSAPDQPGCILSWQSFAEPANTDLITAVYNDSTGFNGQKRRREDMLCTNPVTGSSAPSSPAQSAGTTVPTDPTLSDATLTPGAVGARCEGGFLMINGAGGELPEFGRYVLPGNNYHVFDYALFWGDIRRDLERRLRAWTERR
jgi:pimeloyl-ACP methyl ester carboxylesterase